MMFIVSVIFVIASSSLARGQTCDNCISILNCPPLAALVSKPSRTQEEINELRRASCGFEGSTPKVCCPQSCSTPDGMPGSCVDIYQCPHLSGLLKPPVPREIAQYLQQSKCNGPAQYSVCCGSSAPSVATSAPNVEVGNCENRVFVFPPDPRTTCCGIDSGATNKIIGGEAAAIDEFPWIAIIEYVKNNKIKLLCGASLISSRYVLTAGHCVAGPVLDAGTPKNIRLGEYDTTNNGQDCIEIGDGLDCNDPLVVIPIEKYMAHPEYNVVTKRNDIGIIRLAQNAPFTDFIRPICLPSTDITNIIRTPFNLTAAGWGAINETVSKSSIKLFVNLPYISLQQCQGVYSVPRRKANLWDKQLCAGGQKDRDSCKGDSGGPLMHEDAISRRYELTGVVSFGPKPCGVENIPGVYTKVFEYKNWINSVIQL